MMSSRKKVLVAITARPSYSRIRSALVHLRDDHDVDLKVLCSGSALLDRYGRVVDFIREDGFDVVDEMYTFVEGDDLINMALTTSNTITYTATILRRERPDVAMTIADRRRRARSAAARRRGPRRPPRSRRARCGRRSRATCSSASAPPTRTR